MNQILRIGHSYAINNRKTPDCSTQSKKYFFFLYRKNRVFFPIFRLKRFFLMSLDFFRPKSFISIFKNQHIYYPLGKAFRLVYEFLYLDLDVKKIGPF